MDGVLVGQPYGTIYTTPVVHRATPIQMTEKSKCVLNSFKLLAKFREIPAFTLSDIP